MSTVLNLAGKSVSVVVPLHYDYYSKLPLSLAKKCICFENSDSVAVGGGFHYKENPVEEAEWWSKKEINVSSWTV